MTAFYDFFRYIKLYSTDGTTLEHTIEADAVTDSLSISRGAGVAWTGASAATDSFKIDVNYNLEVPVGTTTLRLTDVNSVDQDIELHAGGNMTITRNHSGSITLASLMGGVSRVITSATQASPVVITTNNNHDFTEGTPVTIVDVVGMTQLNGNEYYADVLTSNTLALYQDDVLSVPLDGTGFTAYTSGGVATGEYAGAKKLNDLTDVKFNAPNFADSIMLGYTTTGTLNNAHSNIFIGKDAGKTVTSGNQNTVIGHKAGDSITDGTNNVLIGAFAGDTIQGGDGNVIISAGHSTDPAGGWSNNITSLVTGDGKRRLYIGNSNPNVDGTVLDGQYYSNIWHHYTQVGAFRAQGESGATTVTNPPYATTYLERAYITIDATNNPVTHQPARIHVGGGHLALHGGDGFVVGSTMTEYNSTWGASGTRTPGTYTGVTVASGVSGNHPTFTVVVAVSDGSITSVTSETTGSEIYDLTGGNTISDSQIGNGGAPDIQFKYEGVTTTQAKLTMIGDTTLAVTPGGATINSKDVILDGAVTTHLIPDTHIAYDLGSATHKFRDLYLDGSSIHLGSTILRDDGAGHLQVNLTNILEIAADDSTIRTINSGESIKFIGAGSVTTATDAEGNLTITSTGIPDLVSDTTPQLGGTLDTNGNDIDMNGTGSIIFDADNDSKISASVDDEIVLTVMNNDALTIKAMGEAWLRSPSTPTIYLTRTDASPTAGDKLGSIHARGKDDASNELTYGQMDFFAEAIGNGAERGSMVLRLHRNNTMVDFYKADATSGVEQNIFYKDIKADTGVNIVFEGATDNANETTLTVTDPTAGQTITLPDATGTVALQSWVNTQIAASSTSDLTGSVFADDSTVMVDGVNATLPNIRGTMTGHLIPSIDAAYDFGNAEYKIRHLFLSSNSLWIGDEHKVTVEGGKKKFKKRKVGIVPAGVQTLLITSVFADTNALLVDFKAQIHDPAPANILNPDHVDFNPPTNKWLDFLALHGHPNKSVDDVYNNASDFDDEKEDTDKATTEGDLVYFDGSEYKRLPLGTATHVLTANGAGNAPEWSAPSGGGGAYLEDFHITGSGESNGSSTISIPATTTKIEYDVVSGGGAQYDNTSTGPNGQGKTGTYTFTAGDLTALSGNSYQLTLQAGGYGGNENTGTAQPGKESWIRLNGTSIVEAQGCIGGRTGGGQTAYCNGTNVSPTGCIDKSHWIPTYGEGSPNRVVGFVRVRCYS